MRAHQQPAAPRADRDRHPDGLAGSRAGGAQNVQPVVPRLSNGREALPASGPASGQRALLAEAGFVLEVDFDSLVGVGGGNRFQPLREVFLKASWAWGSQFSWMGLGHW